MSEISKSGGREEKGEEWMLKAIDALLEQEKWGMEGTQKWESFCELRRGDRVGMVAATISDFTAQDSSRGKARAKPKAAADKTQLPPRFLKFGCHEPAKGRRRRSSQQSGRSMFKEVGG